MAMQKGEHYRCQNEDCGCEISVTKAASDEGGDENPRCCCGSEMELMQQKRQAARSRNEEAGRSQQRPQ